MSDADGKPGEGGPAPTAQSSTASGTAVGTAAPTDAPGAASGASTPGAASPAVSAPASSVVGPAAVPSVPEGSGAGSPSPAPGWAPPAPPPGAAAAPLLTPTTSTPFGVSAPPVTAPPVEPVSSAPYEPPGRVGVLLIHRGEPATVAEVRPWLKRWYADPYAFSVPFGRETQGLFAAALSRWDQGAWTGRLKEAGGSSPFLGQVLHLADELQRRLNAEAEGTANAKYKVRVGTPYGEPTIEQALAAFKADGVARVVAISLYPQQCDRFIRPLRHALAQAPEGLEVSVIDRYPVAPGYVASLRASVDAALFRAGEATVLFAALAIDRRDEQAGDPYPDQLKLTTAAVMEGLTAPWRVSWLDSGAPGLPTQFVLDRLYEKGQRNVVLVPLGSAVDELATVHALDVTLRQHARARGFEKVERARAVAAEPGFVEALRAELLSHLERVSRLGFKG